MNSSEGLFSIKKGHQGNKETRVFQNETNKAGGSKTVRQVDFCAHQPRGEFL